MARVRTAWTRVCQRLLAERNERGHWTGELCSSALSTATAVVALELAQRNGPEDPAADTWRELCRKGIRYLLEAQRDDGGWGDTDRSYSNVATTMLAEAALVVTRDWHATWGWQDRAENARLEARRYIDHVGGIAALRRRYGRDKTFAVPILACAALAGVVDWKEVAPLPFELAVFPQSWYRFLRLPVVSYAIPALVAIGQVRYHFRPPRNPALRAIRRLAL
ncbi:MAG TPA: squalene--hopene cyclase, partial [Planctomycetaceae bacterium]|nr:squalene--hopene cyclase [Planctomycetaceae bacterium]